MIPDFEEDSFDFENETLVDLKYRYLEILEAEGCLNEVCFDKPEWDDESEVYTKEFHGVEKLMEMIPDDVLVRQFGEFKVLPLLEERDNKRGVAV